MKRIFILAVDFLWRNLSEKWQSSFQSGLMLHEPCCPSVIQLDTPLAQKLNFVTPLQQNKKVVSVKHLLGIRPVFDLMSGVCIKKRNNSSTFKI
jgi:hypothetical protein